MVAAMQAGMSRIGRRAVLAMPLIGVAGAARSQAVGAWPTGRVTIVVPFPPGGTTDVLARIVGAKLAEAWGVPVIVENRAGAAGNLGTAAFLRGPNDGHTFLLHTSSLAVAPAVYRNLGFDVSADLVPITSVGSVPFLLVVNPSVPARSVAELVALLRARPGQLTYASNGAGTIVHLAFEVFLREAGNLAATHVPYRGSAPALADLVGGQTQAMMESVVTLIDHVRAGRLRAVASTGPARLAQLPEVPTVAESGLPGFEAGSWYGLFAARGTPSATIAAVRSAVARAVALPEIRERMVALGAEGGGEPPAAFAATVAADLARWNGVARAINLTLD
jgi:tripartite-type tricarboxylate transporter receptor subunit TctC